MIKRDPLSGQPLHAIAFFSGNPEVEVLSGVALLRPPLCARLAKLTDQAGLPPSYSSVLRQGSNAFFPPELEQDIKLRTDAADTKHNRAGLAMSGLYVPAAAPSGPIAPSEPSPSSSSSSLSLPSPSASYSSLYSPTSSFVSSSSTYASSSSSSSSSLSSSSFSSSSSSLSTGAAEETVVPSDSGGDMEPPCFWKGSRMLLVYDIPSHISISEFHQFITVAVPSIMHVQIVTLEAHVSTAESYALLLQFRSSEETWAFWQEYRGQVFNSLEQDICRLACLAAVEFGDKRPHFAFPYNEQGLAGRSSTTKLSSSDSDDVPACPVCLEVIVPSQSAMITILCNHVFHFDCLSKWADSTCPVCRYVKQPAIPSVCWVCGKSNYLWLCLICGHVGCGDQSEGHAVAHFQETQHPFSLNVGTQRVWDYVANNYVHRLIRSKADDYLVEWFNERRRRRGPACSKLIKDSEAEQHASVKLEELVVEYNYLLSSELAKQRIFFERQHELLEQKADQELEAAQIALLSATEQSWRTQQQLNRCSQENQSKTKTIEQLSQQLKEITSKNQRLREEGEKLRSQQQRLRDDQTSAARQLLEEKEHLLQEKDNQLTLLEEELRDLQFFIDTKKKVDQSSISHDISQGTIQLGADAGDDVLSLPQAESKSVLRTGPWRCRECNFQNPMGGDHCVMCNVPASEPRTPAAGSGKPKGKKKSRQKKS